MKRRIRERVLILIVSLSVLLSSTGAYSVFAQTTGASEDGNTTISSSSTAAASEQDSTTSAQNFDSESEKTDTQPNVVSEGGKVNSDTLQGEGTAASPYLVYDAADFIKIQSIVNDTSKKDKYFALADDIDLSSISYSTLKANNVFSGTLVSVDKSLSDAAPKSVKMILDGRNHRIYGLNVENSDSGTVAIFGYISANSVISNVVFDNIDIRVTSDKALINSAASVYNKGEINGCTFKNITIDVARSADNTSESAVISDSIKTDSVTGIAGVNAGSIVNTQVTGSKISVAGKKVNVGLLSGENTGSIKNVYIADSGINAPESVETGFIAGTNYGSVSSSTVKDSTAIIGDNSIFGAVAGLSSGSVDSCVTSGLSEGSDYAAGIIGKAASSDGKGSASVTNCYTFFITGGNGGYGAVAASGEGNYKNNYWSSELSGKTMAYENAVKSGDMIRAARLFTVKAGATISIDKSAFSAKFGEASLVYDTNSSIYFSENGVALKDGAGIIKAHANEPASNGVITYNLRTVINSGYNSSTELTTTYKTVVLGVTNSVSGNGISEDTALTISSDADFAMVKYAPFANYKLEKDITVSSKWEPVSFGGTFNGGGHTVNVSTEVFSSVTGSVKNVSFVQNGQIASAVFGDAIGAEFEGVQYLKGSSANNDLFVGTVAAQSITGSFINRVYGYTDIISCFTNVPIYVGTGKLSNIGGLAGYVGFKGNNIINSGASTYITGAENADLSNTAALIGSVSANEGGSIRNCYATLNSKLTSYAIVGGGNSDVEISNSVYGSYNGGTMAAPKSFTKVSAAQWLFNEGESAFITGKGSVLSINLPKDIIDTVSASDFTVSFDANEVSVDLQGTAFKDGTAYIPVQTAEKAVTVKNSTVALIHKPTGLRAAISLSNGLEKDKDGNYIIANASDFEFISENIKDFGSASYVISRDLDFSGIEFAPVGGAADSFSGKIEGNGHTIKGLNITANAKAGLFGTLDSAKISNIKFDSAVITSESSYAGVLAAQISGKSVISGVVFTNCKAASAENYAGVIAGDIRNSSVSDVKIDKAEVRALGFAGIAAGNITASEVSALNISGSKVYGENLAGSFGYADNSVITKVSIDSSEIVSAKIAGGIAGNAKDVEISSSSVSGTTVKAQNSNESANCAAGAVSGKLSGKVKDVKVTGCNITASGKMGAAGGIAGFTKAVEAEIISVDASTSVAGNISGGIFGDVSDKTSLKDSSVYASITGSVTDYNLYQGSGGIIGRVQNDNFGDIRISGVNTTGKVYSYKFAGGLIGSVMSKEADGISITDCISANTVETSKDGIKTSGKVIGFVRNLDDDTVNSAIKNVVFSSYSSMVDAYGNIKAEKSYTDLDKSVKTSLNEKLSGNDKVVVKVENDAAKYGFVFDSAKGWQSASSDKIAVTASAENEVTLKTFENADAAVAADYKYSKDSNIVLRIHFDAGSVNRTALKGNGTKENPYQINSKADFALVSKYADSSAWFTLLTDLEFAPADFSFGGILYNDGNSFGGFGTDSAPFNGTFLGNGHIISGLYAKGNDEASLFGVTKNAEISGLKINNAQISAKKIAAALAAKSYDSTFTNISVNSSVVSAQGADSIAAAFAGYAENSQFNNIAVNADSISAVSQTLAYSTSYAAAVVARDNGSALDSVKVSADTAVESDGSAAGFVGSADSTHISSSETFASINGENAAVIAAALRGKLSVSGLVAGGTVSAKDKAAGIAAKANAAIDAENITISADISGKVIAVAAADADKSVYTDSADSDVRLENIVYSSYQIPAGIFGSEEINAYQQADYLGGAIDVNTAKPVNGEFAAVGGESVKLSELVDFGKEVRNYKLANVISNPENLVKYNSADGTVAAAATNVENAELVMVYDNGIKTAVKMISVVGMTGKGTQENPFIISNADTMLLLGVYPDACFRMSGSVALSGKWTPVENFTGKFDGNGFTLTGLDTEGKDAGLFASLASDALVTNVKIKNASVKGTQNAGALAAVISDNAAISDIEIIASDISAEKYAGALAGSSDSANAVIADCKVSGGKVSAENAGGVIGIATGTNTIKNTVVSAAEVIGKEAAGGIIGSADGRTTVDGAVSQASVKADFAEGGIIGTSGKETSVINSKSLASLSGSAEHAAAIVAKFTQLPEDNEEFAAKFANNETNGDYSEFEPAIMQYQNYSASPAEESKYSFSGKGTAENPYIIATAQDLAQIPDGSKDYFALANDIKLGSADYSFTVNENGETVDGAFAKGYRPVKYFAGEFDGRGYTISGLYINSSESYVGLFSRIVGTGLVKNLHVEILTEEDGLGYYGITGNTYVGGIAGYCEASGGIENCTVKGSVSGVRSVGGIVGGLASSTVTGAVVVGDVTAQKAAGGAVGTVTGTSSITNSAVSCTVKSAGGTLVGINDGELTVSDVLANGMTYGVGNIAVAVNKGSIDASRMIIAGTNTDAKQGIMSAQKTKDVYADITKLNVTDDNITGLEREELTAQKPEGLDEWNHTNGSYPVPQFEDKYSAELAEEAAAPLTADIKEEKVGNVAVDYTLTNNTGDEIADRIRTGILIKSNVNGQTVTADFFTSSSSDRKKIYNLLVTSGGFYIDSDLPDGYGIEITAKDEDGKDINVTNAGSKGDYVSLGTKTSVSLEISIVKAEKPWGLTSVWKSLKK